MATQGTKGACDFAASNTFAALSIDCATGSVGPAEASAAGGSPGPATVPDPASSSGAGSAASAATGRGGDAAALVNSGRSGNCIIRLVNIHADLTVICITGSSGRADGTATGGHSGSATFIAAAPGRATERGGDAGAAASGPGGNAMAVISSGGTGTCTIFLVNVMAKVTVLCITGESGAASGRATGGSSGAALTVATSAAGDAGHGARAASGPGGRATSLVTSGGTGNCAISLSNAFGSISLLCRTGNSGPARGRAVAGDSGPSLVMLKAPSRISPATPSEVASPFSHLRANNRRPLLAPAHRRASGGRREGSYLPPVTTAAAAAVAPSGATVATPPDAFLPATGLGTSVPMSLAFGLILSGGAAVATTTSTTTSRRRRRRPQVAP